MNKFLLAVFFVICAVIGFLTLNGGHYAGVSLPWAQPAAASSAIISYTFEGGFQPSSITVNSGATVEIRNLYTQQIVVESDTTTTDQSLSDPDLNLGAIDINSHKDFTVTRKGTFQYHNDEHPYQTGLITIK